MAKLFEGKKIRLVDIEESPVGLTVKQAASAIVDLARENVREIFTDRLNEEDLEDVLKSINYKMEGTRAVVGIRDRGEIEVYLAAKELKESRWLQPAHDQVMGNEDFFDHEIFDEDF